MSPSTIESRRIRFVRVRSRIRATSFWPAARIRDPSSTALVRLLSVNGPPCPAGERTPGSRKLPSVFGPPRPPLVHPPKDRVWTRPSRGRVPAPVQAPHESGYRAFLTHATKETRTDRSPDGPNDRGAAPRPAQDRGVPGRARC